MSKITQTRFQQQFHPSTARVFVNVDPLIEKPVDQFFDDNKLSSLPFASKAWSAVKKARNKAVIEQLRTLPEIPTDAKITFSHKCGCSCGCSPGFIVKGALRELAKMNAWVTIEVPEPQRERVQAQLAAAIAKAKVKLLDELAQHCK